MGALHAIENADSTAANDDTEYYHQHDGYDKVKFALEAAAKFSNGVSSPFLIKQLNKL